MKKHTILCIDDEPNVLHALNRLLRREGHHIITTADGKEALDIITRQEIALVLVDQRMPDFDSVCVLEKIKEMTPDTVRIVVSAYAPASMIIDAINRGEVYRFVTKPWDDEQLKLIVKEALERYDLIRERANLINTISEKNRELQKLNIRLGQLYEERSQDLTYSQQILVELPVPVIGINPDNTIAFTNRVAQQLFGENDYHLIESPIVEALPPEVVQFVEDYHNAGEKQARPPRRIDLTVKECSLRLQCQSLKGQHGLRGYLLTFHELK